MGFHACFLNTKKSNELAQLCNSSSSLMMVNIYDRWFIQLNSGQKREFTTGRLKLKDRIWYGAPKKAKLCNQQIPAEKIGTTVIWYTKGIMLVDGLPAGTTINAAFYSETFKSLQGRLEAKEDESCQSKSFCFTSPTSCLSNSRSAWTVQMGHF